MLQAGCTAADVDAETLPHGLATPLGVDPACGVVGLCLQGGVGPSPSVLSKQHANTSKRVVVFAVLRPYTPQGDAT